MYKFYLPPNSYNYLVKKYPKMDWEKMDVKVAVKLNEFLQQNCQYNLVFMDSHFKNYIPIIVAKEIDDNVIIMFEFLYNIEKNLGEIYNICTHILHRKNGHAKGLKQVFDELQSALKCDLWIAVALNNPLYDIATDIYLKMGFISDIKVSYKTPSEISFPIGFLGMNKYYKIQELDLKN